MSLNMVFMDQRGTTFHDDLSQLEELNLMYPDCRPESRRWPQKRGPRARKWSPFANERGAQKRRCPEMEVPLG